MRIAKVNITRGPGAFTLCLNWRPSIQECFENFWIEYDILGTRCQLLIAVFYEAFKFFMVTNVIKFGWARMKIVGEMALLKFPAAYGSVWKFPIAIIVASLYNL